MAVTAAEPRRSLGRSNAIVTIGTAVSRLTGLARVIVVGVVFGGGELADAYTAANNAPNALYELLVGGVLSAGLVPLFADLRVRGDRDGERAVASVSVLVLAGLTVVAVLAAPLVFRLVSLVPSSEVDADEFRSAGTVLARIFLAQIFFYGCTALASAILNARRRFFAAAWAPVIANLVTVAGFLVLPAEPVAGWGLSDVLENDRFALTLGLGATLGIASTSIVLMLAARHAMGGFRFTFQPRHPAVKRLVVLSGWTLGYVVANQVALIVVQNLTQPGSGGRYAYSQAYTFFVLPHGLLAVSIATTFAPELARAVSRRRREEFADLMSLGVRAISLITLPAGLGTFVLARPIVGLLLQHGEFTAADADLVADVLRAFSIGLVGFSVYLFALRGFYAHLDTKTPFVVNCVECTLNVVLAVALVGRFGVVGLAASFAAAYLVSAVLAIGALSRRRNTLALGPIARSVASSAGAALAMAVAVWASTRGIGGTAGTGAALRVAVGIPVGVVTFFASIRVIAPSEWDELTGRLLRSLRPSSLRNPRT